MQTRESCIQIPQYFHLFIIVDPFLVVKCVLARVDVKEEIGLLRLNDFVKTNRERLVDGSFAWVYFGCLSHIIEVELGRKISVEIDTVLVFPCALTFFSHREISHPVGPVEYFQFHFLCYLRLALKSWQPFQAYLWRYQLAGVDIAHNNTKKGCFWGIDGQERIRWLSPAYFLI